jgi:hypothetical protein
MCLKVHNKPDSLSLSYQGYFNDSITRRLTALVDKVLVENNYDMRKRHLMKAFIVEQVQNVQRYSIKSRQGTLEVGRENGSLFVETVNPIAPQSVDPLQSQLDELAGCDAEEIERRYRDELRRPLRPGTQGAGLGFYFLAKKSSRALSYRFINPEGDNPSFSLKSYI